MGKVAAEHRFTGPTTGITTYNSNYTMLGSLMKQYSGATSADKYVSTYDSSLTNIQDATANQTNWYFLPHVIKWDNDTFWVFLSLNTTAAATRIVALFEYKPSSNVSTFKGTITLQGTQITGVKNIRGTRALLYTHTTGTVGTVGSSSTILGTGTTFVDERIAVGARIGFGTTAATQVSTWYEITAINSNTSLTINVPVTLSAGTQYVIEELRIAMAINVSTAGQLWQSGIYLIKGLNYSTFSLGNTNIPESTTIDNIRASYLLKDLAPTLFTVTVANPGTINRTAHGLRVNDSIILGNTGVAPGGLALSTVYYVTSASTDSFNVATTPGGASINITSTGTTPYFYNTNWSLSMLGLDVEPQISSTEHNAYLINSEASSNIRVVKYNLRAPLVPNSGSGATGSLVARTNLATYGGTLDSIGNTRLCTVKHGISANIPSIYFSSRSRINRIPVSAVTDNGFGYLTDFMIEIPPGGTSNAVYTTNNLMYAVDYSETIDRLIITNNAQRFATYSARYEPNGEFERIFGANMNRYKFSFTPTGASSGLFPLAVPSFWTEGGFFFVIPHAQAVGLNWLLVFPGGADGYYGSYSNQRIITAKIATTNASSLYRCYVESQEYIGTYSLGYPPDSYRVYFRTSGIDDNSGSWTEVPAGGDLTSFSPSDYIQFMFELDTLGEICVPPRIYGVTVIYDDFTTDIHYQPSVKYSDYVNKRFAWWFGSAWGTTVPNLRVRLYDANTNNLLVDDNTASPSGTFEKSTDGGSTWSTYDDTDRSNSTTYIRYTPSSLGDNIKVKFLLTQL